MASITYRHGNLFTAADFDSYLCHCVSADFALGAGIAVEFNRRFNLRSALSAAYPNAEVGSAVRIGRVLNLITKQKYYQKPTYETLTESIRAAAAIAKQLHIRKLSMPFIACGLDRLQWQRVEQILESEFDFDIDIFVFSL